MECSCVYCDVDSFCELLHTETRKARKQHKCYECNNIIEVGYSYLCETTMFEGKFEEIKTCSVCRELRNVFFCEGFYYGQVIEYLKEHIWESNGEISESCIAELSPKAREVVCEMIEHCW